MVTGQSFVLYSRLHLVVKEERLLRSVLFMIIWNGVTLHIPTTVMTFGSVSPAWALFVVPFQYMERVQMTIFCLQEFAISGIYLWATIRLLRPVYRRRTRSVMMQLVWINGLIIVMDIALLAMEYQGNYTIEATLKSMVYSIKLKLEFAVLNQLMRLANSSQNAAVISYNDEGPPSNHGGKKGRSKPLAFIRRALPGRNPFHDEENSIRNSSINHTSVHARQLAESAAMASACASPTSTSGNHFLHPTASNTSARTGRSVPMTGINKLRTNSQPVWNPQLDRHCKLSESHLENVQSKERAASVSTIYNNPAAFFPPSKPRSRDPLDTIDSECQSPLTKEAETYFPSTNTRACDPDPESPLSSPPVSPSGRTPPRLKVRPASTANPDVNQQQEQQPQQPPIGLLKSTRPSVTDWANSSEGESRSSSEVRLDPHELAANHLFDQGKIRDANEKMREWNLRDAKVEQNEKGRGGEASGGGLEFMTSALQKP